jgi:acetoin utilization deacetylase AcuC-like enzyme
VDPDRPIDRPKAFPDLRDYYTYDFEDPIVAGTWEAAYWSAQCALTAADRVAGGERAAYALCRPPGHHATIDQYGGFCYLNHAAIAARSIGAEGRVAILDIDYHHGNGTQSIFYADPAVLYVSLHAHPALDYPYYWGFPDESGTGAGYGTNVNLPLPLGADNACYLETLDEGLTVIRRFAPAALILSLGLDALADDPIGKFALTPSGWTEIGRRIAALELPTVLIQEGGYRLESLGSHAVSFLSTFIDPL